MTTIDIDPRIEARRDAVRRATERRRVRILVSVAVVVALVVGTYLTIESPLLAVNHVEVAGTAHLSPAAVRNTADVGRGRPLLRVDLNAVAARVEQLPWVDRVKVTRSLPRTLHITITEARPVAFVRGHGGVAVIGPDNRVIALTTTPPAGAIEISGVRTVPALHELVSPAGTAHLADSLPATIASRVRAISLRATIIAIVLDRGEIRLGSITDLPAKLAAAEAVLRQTNSALFHYIDVSVPLDPVLHP
jgi:cell division protein FtsQ